MTVTIEPVASEGPHHNYVVRTLPLTKDGQRGFRCLLSCAHEVQVFGHGVVHQGTVVLCTQCRDECRDAAEYDSV